MNPTKPDDSSEEQTEQNNQQREPQMDPPRAAAMADVERAESKAEKAGQRAQDAGEKADAAHGRVEELRAEKDRLREEIAGLQNLLERTVAAVRQGDEHLDAVEENQAGATTPGKYESEPIADALDLPEYEELESVETDNAPE